LTLRVQPTSEARYEKLTKAAAEHHLMINFHGAYKPSLWSLDLFRTESMLLKTHWVVVIMDQFSRRIIGFGLQAVAVDGVALCRMFNQAISEGIPH
jgi:hypothetical protein